MPAPVPFSTKLGSSHLYGKRLGIGEGGATTAVRYLSSNVLIHWVLHADARPAAAGCASAAPLHAGGVQPAPAAVLQLLHCVTAGHPGRAAGLPAAGKLPSSSCSAAGSDTIPWGWRAKRAEHGGAATSWALCSAAAPLTMTQLSRQYRVAATVPILGVVSKWQTAYGRHQTITA